MTMLGHRVDKLLRFAWVALVRHCVFGLLGLAGVAMLGHCVKSLLMFAWVVRVKHCACGFLGFAGVAPPMLNVNVENQCQAMLNVSFECQC